MVEGLRVIFSVTLY